MSRKTDVLIQQLSIQTILNFESIKMPIFQRKYSWGEEKKESKALDYFEDFLINKDNNSFFGSLFIHSNLRFDYSLDKTVSVYLSDGQHRMITLAISAFALYSNLERLNLIDDDKSEKDSILSHSIFKNILKIKLECIINNNGFIVNIIPFIQQKIQELEKINNDIISQKSLLQSKLNTLSQIKNVAERDKKRKELKKDNNKTIKELEKDIKSINEIPVFFSYKKIYNYISEKNSNTILRMGSKFIDRINSLRTGVISLQAEQGEKVSDEVIEAEAFSMFTQMNGQAIPLSSGELFKSFISQKISNNDSIIKFFQLESEEYNIINNHFGLNDPEKIVDFLQKLDLGKEPSNINFKTPYTWVRSLHNTKDLSKIKQIHEAFTSLVIAYDSIQKSTDEIKGLFHIFLNIQNTLPTTIYIAKNFSDLTIKHSTELRKLLKVLILISIMISYIPNSGKRPNLARDLHHQIGTIDSGLTYVRNHFDVLDNFQLKNIVKKHLSSFSFGQSKFRKLAELLLVIADVNNWGNQNTISKADYYNYEHVFPQSYDKTSNTKDGITTPSTLEVVFNDFYEDADFSKYVDLLGNGALLNENSNKSLKNSSPYIKLQKLDGINNHVNSWWPSHAESLRSSNGFWDKDFIEQRSFELAEKICDWLFYDL